MYFKLLQPRVEAMKMRSLAAVETVARNVRIWAKLDHLFVP
jgi:hypothetical protein